MIRPSWNASAFRTRSPASSYHTPLHISPIAMPLNIYTHLFAASEFSVPCILAFLSFSITFFHLFLFPMLKHSDNEASSCLFPRRSYTPTRVCRVEYLVPYDFLDLQIFVKFLLKSYCEILILSIEFFDSPFTSRFNYNYLRDSYVPPYITSPRLFPEFSPPHVLFPSRESSPWITLHLARLQPYLAPR